MRPIQGLATLLLTIGAAAYGQEAPIAVELSAHKVVRVADGSETFAAADKLAPGDVVEYRAVYRNRSAGAVRDVAASLPVPPAGFEYVAETARPMAVSASLDGKTFSSLPLRRTVVLTDGRREVQIVPAREYRALRWQVGDLAPGASVTVKARMRLTDGPVQSR